jgi:hypothetical protein
MPTLTPVDNDPFTAGVKLTPVDHDPFSVQEPRVNNEPTLYDAKTGMPYTRSQRAAGEKEFGQGIISGIKEAPFWLNDLVNTGVEAAGGKPVVAGSKDIYKKLGAPIPEPKTGLGVMGEIAGGVPTLVGGKLAPKAAGELVTKAIPAADVGLLPVSKLAQKHAIPMSMDEVTGSRALKAAQKVGQDLPFSGQQAFREKQMEAWNKGILKNLGEEGMRITPEVMNSAYKRLGKEFDALGKGKKFSVGQPFDTGLNEIRGEYGIFKKPDGTVIASSKTKDAVDSFENTVAELKREANPDGTISGEKLNKMRAKVNKYIRDSDDYDTKVLLGDLENHIIDTMTADPKVAAEFAQTKQQYKNFIALEPLVQKGKAGNISPIGLSNRVARIYGRAYTTGNAGDIGELARVGREILPELSGSDTQTRQMYNKMAGLIGTAGAGSYSPITTAVGLGGNRAFQEFFNRNQDLIKKAIEKAEQSQVNTGTPIESVVRTSQ